MVDSWLERTRTLREEAWAAVLSTEAYIAFKALDEAVMALGGATVAIHDVKAVSGLTRSIIDAASRRMSDNRKPSHADAAERALLENRAPLTIAKLLEASTALGAEIGGSDPLANFRSTLSKDNRFYSVKDNGVFYWWLRELDLPPRRNEATATDLLSGAAASSSNASQEGGDGHGPATT